jgi:sugar lactone lactonase YvrE
MRDVNCRISGLRVLVEQSGLRVLVVALGDETGHLLGYDRRIAVLHSDLPYPNGVAVGADDMHVVVAHTGLSELRRYWVLRGTVGDLRGAAGQRARR